MEILKKKKITEWFTRFLVLQLREQLEGDMSYFLQTFCKFVEQYYVYIFTNVETEVCLLLMAMK